MDEQNVNITQVSAGTSASEHKNQTRHTRRGGKPQRHHGGNTRSEKKKIGTETVVQDAAQTPPTNDGRPKNANSTESLNNVKNDRRHGNGTKQHRRSVNANDNGATKNDDGNVGNSKQDIKKENEDTPNARIRRQKQSSHCREHIDTGDNRIRRNIPTADPLGDSFADISLSGNSRQPIVVGAEEDDYSDIAATPNAFKIPDEDILPECILPTTQEVAAAPAHTRNEGTTEVVGVKFESTGKSYYFAPGADKFCRGDHAIVETTRGVEYGEISMGNTFVPNESIVQPLRAIGRRATKEDARHDEENHIREREALVICTEKIAARGLDMKLVDASYTFDNSKLIFYFTAAGRIDFRELVKDLAAIFRTRIELRQIGIRDEAKMLGGCGVCGRKLCCSSFLPNFNQVSIRMAKEQGLSLSSSKISGCCGRLMCCLRFEHETYEREIRITPPVESIVETEDGRGVVTETTPIAGMVKVKLDEKPGDPPRVYHRDNVRVITRGQRRIDAADTADEADVIPED